MNTHRRRRITQTELARRAGISQSSVSKILADPDRAPFAPEVRERVVALARKHGCFKTHRPTRALAVLVRGNLNDFLTSTYYARFSQGLIPAADRAGYHVLFGCFPEDGRLPSLVADGKVDGALVHASRTGPPFQKGMARLADEIPVVLLNGCLEHPAVSSVMPDNRGGIEQALLYLRDFGHSRIAYVGGGPDCENQHHDERVRTYRAFMERHGLPTCEDGIYLTKAAQGNAFEATEAEMEAALTRFLAARPAPTAVVAGADLMALALMRVAQRRGLRIPQDLSLTGYDNTEAGRYSTPRLTSVEQPLEEMARAAVGELLSRLKRPLAPARRLCFETTLEVRDSAALARPRSPADA